MVRKDPWEIRRTRYLGRKGENGKTGDPLLLYVNTGINDTIYAPTRTVVNSKLSKTAVGKYVYADAAGDSDDLNSNAPGSTEAGRTNDGDYKREVDEDGDIKITDGNKEIKIDRETGETKVK